MKRFVISLLILMQCASLFAVEQAVSLDSIVSGVYRPAVSEFTPMTDPKYYTSVSGNKKKINKYEYATGKLVQTILDLDNVKESPVKEISGYVFSPIGNRILVWENTKPIYRHSFLTEYYVFDIKRNMLEPLSGKGLQRDARFSPDGRSIAFINNNNIFIKRLDYGSELTVTKDGATDTISNGATDWVYEEEFGTTYAYDWAPDGQSLAYLKFDERSIPEYSFTVFGENRNGSKPVYYPGGYSYRYPAAGEQNSKVSLYVYQLNTRSSRKINLPSGFEYIPRIRFACRTNQLAVMTLNRAQDMFKMYFVNPKSGIANLVLSDHDDRYVEPEYDAIHFSTKYFTYLSDKDGYRHLYIYGPNGGLIKKLTSGKYDVIQFLGCDTVKNKFYYISDEESPLKRAVYEADMKGDRVKVSTRPGCCKATFNSNYSMFVQTSSEINEPPATVLCNVSGKELRVISENSNLKQIITDKKTFITVPASDGQKLNGWMLKPDNFDPSKKYPVLQVQYSGPDAQAALDEFKVDWEYYLAENGIIVVCVDGRGTGGRGADFRRSAFMKLGVVESEDQIAVANWLGSQPYVDKNRIGIWGWSYGGFITLVSMTDKNNPFKAGIAVAPVCDYRYYNTIYTERYMKTPAENKEGYDAGSPILRAKDLSGKLLLIHGMADDNVRVNQSMDFVEALISSGKQFDMQVYPTSNHSILGVKYRLHLYRRMADFIIGNL